MSKKFKLKTGDNVVVITGREKGKKSTIKKVITKDNKVVLAGLNQVKKHVKPSMKSAGGIELKDMPIHISNVALVDPKLGVATKVGYKILEDGSKVRVALKSGEVVDK